MRLCQSQIYKVTAAIVDNIMIANDLVTLLPNCHTKWSMLFVKPNVTVADAYESLRYDVQLVHLHVLKINLLVVFVFGVKSAWLQAAAHLVEVLLIYAHRFIAEKLVRCYNVPEEKLDH